MFAFPSHASTDRGIALQLDVHMWALPDSKYPAGDNGLQGAAACRREVRNDICRDVIIVQNPGCVTVGMLPVRSTREKETNSKGKHGRIKVHCLALDLKHNSSRYVTLL